MKFLRQGTLRRRFENRFGSEPPKQLSQSVKEPNSLEVSKSLKRLETLAKNHPSKYVQRLAKASCDKFYKLKCLTKPSKSMHDLLKFVLDEGRPICEEPAYILRQKYSPLKVYKNNDFEIESLEIDHQTLNRMVESKFRKTDFDQLYIDSLVKSSVLRDKQQERSIV